ncbi:hypothetical protein KIL84_004915 [Mauremys mutica]|uniref:Uncharacterized protein n=1 Tax=Mauremys mutica TaxID=74926 RepID=A0A9D3XP01_9SAUR|nr:hypothetical protein KIL84_004915 [Mauremys mutica]
MWGGEKGEVQHSMPRVYSISYTLILTLHVPGSVLQQWVHRGTPEFKLTLEQSYPLRSIDTVFEIWKLFLMNHISHKNFIRADGNVIKSILKAPNCVLMKNDNIFQYFNVPFLNDTLIQGCGEA